MGQGSGQGMGKERNSRFAVHRRVGNDPVTFGLVLAPEFYLSEFAIVMDLIEALSTLEAGDNEVTAKLISAKESDAEVRSSSGIVVKCDADRSLDRLSAVIMVGAKGYLAGRYHDMTALLRLTRRAGIDICALSSAVFPLAASGILDRRSAAVHGPWVHLFQERFPAVTVRRTYFDHLGALVTAVGGVYAANALDILFRKYTRFEPREIQRAITRILPKTALKHDEQVQPSLGDHFSTMPARLRLALEVMERNVEQPISIEEVASAAGISKRQLERLFKKHMDCTPNAAYRGLRLERSVDLLSATTLSITEIALICGFSSPSRLSHKFRERFGITPTAFRRDAHAGVRPGQNFSDNPVTG